MGIIDTQRTIEFNIHIGDVVFFPIGTQHYIKNTCDEDLLFVLALSTGDQVRLWGHQESAKPCVQTKEAFINTCSGKGWMSYRDEKECMKKRIIKTFPYYIASLVCELCTKGSVYIYEVISIIVWQILEDATNIYW